MARIPYPTRDELEEEAARALDGMKPMNVFRMLARADALARPLFDAATRMFSPGVMTLAPRLRQVAILRVAGAMGAEYLVAHHRPISRRARMSELEIDACLGSDRAGWCSLGTTETAVAHYATESTLSIRVADETFEAIRAALSARELVELTVMVGFYNFIGRLLIALQVEAEPAEPPLTKDSK